MDRIMCNSTHKISLGFTNQEFEPGAHICHIFNDDAEREEALLQYLRSGLEGNERTACFSDRLSESSMEKFLSEKKIDFSERKKKGDISISGTKEAYFANNKFDPKKMLDNLKNFYLSAKNDGYTEARVIGEMIPEINTVEGGDRLLEYEAKVLLLQKEYPVTAVCQYDASNFDGALIMDIIKVHPLLVIRGKVVHNPFYIPAEEYLKMN
jgi:hypothetical protein